MASLQILTGEKKGQIVELAGEKLGIGRSLDNDFCAETDSRMSRHHALLERRGTAWIVQDLGSSNGTFIERGGRPLRVAKATPLLDGDIIVAGSQRMSVTVSTAPEEATFVGSTSRTPMMPIVTPPPWQPPPEPVLPAPFVSGGENAGPIRADFERTEAFSASAPPFPQPVDNQSLVAAAPPPFQPAAVHRVRREGHRLLATLLFFLPALISALIALYFTALRSQIHFP